MLKKSLAVVVLTLSFLCPSAYAQNAAMAEMEVRISTLEEKIRELNGKVEEYEHQNKKLSEQLEKTFADLEYRLNQLEKSPQAGSGNNTNSVNSAPQTVAKSNPAVKKNDSPFTNIEPGDNPDIYSTPPPASGTPKEQYDAAFALTKSGNYDEAIPAFESFIANNPKDKLRENAYYWLGESLYAKADYTQASVTFLECYKQYSKGAKAPDCLLKLSLSMDQLGKRKEACATLAKLKAEFPKQSPAVKARAEKQDKSWKCR